MTDKKELSEQLAIIQKMAAATQAVAKAASEVSAIYSSQSELIKQMGGAIDNVDTAKMAENINKINEVLKGMSDTLKDMDVNKSMEETMKNMDDTNDKVTTLSEKLKDVAAAGKGVKDTNLPGAFKNVSKQTDIAAKSTSSLVNIFGKRFPIAAAAATGAISGFVQGITNVLAVGSSVIGLLGGIASGLFNVGLAVISIPLKMFTGLVDMAAKAGTGLSELLVQIEEVRKQFGSFKGPASGAVMSVTRHLKGFSDTGLSAWRVFGFLHERMQKVREVATAMGATFSSLYREFEENGGAILAYQKGLGIADEEMKGIAQRAITMGEPMSKVLLKITKQSLGLGAAFNLDQKLIARDMGKAIQDVKHFGAVTVQEIGRAAVYAKKLGVELDKIVGTLDAFETFDQAAENAAKLSQSFGITVDAFKMMEAQSPDEQVEMLRKQMKLAGVDASNMNRQQLKLLASTTGLDEATAKQAFSLKNQGMSLDDIKKKSETAEKKQMSQAEAMSKLADSIERMVKAGQEMPGGYFASFFKGFLGGLQMTREFRSIIWNIRRGLIGVYWIGIQTGRAFAKLPMIQELLQGISEFFTPEKYKAFFKVFGDGLLGLVSGKYSFSGVLKMFQTSISGFFDSQSPTVQKLIRGAQGIFNRVRTIAVEGIAWATDKIVDGITFITDLITGKKKMGDVRKGGKGALGFLASAFGPIVDALGQAASKLWPPIKTMLGELLSKVGDAIWDWVKANPGTSAKIAGAFGLLFFGPAVARSLMGMFFGVMTSVLQVGVKQLLESTVVKRAGASLIEGLFSSGGVGAKITASISNTFASAFGPIKDKLSGAFASASPKVQTAAKGLGVIAAAAIGFEIGVVLSDAFLEAQEKWQKAKTKKDVTTANVLGGRDLSAIEKEIAEKEARIKEGTKLFHGGGALDKAVNHTKDMGEALLGGAAALFTGDKGMLKQTHLGRQKQEVENAKKDLARLREKLEIERKRQGAGGGGPGGQVDVGAEAAERLRKQKEEVGFLGATSVEDAGDKIKKLETLSKKIMGKDFNLNKQLDDIRTRLKDVNFNIFDAPQTQALEMAIIQVEKLSGFGKNLKDFSTSIDDAFFEIAKIPGSIKVATKAIGKEGFGSAITIIDDMVKVTNKMSEALSGGNVAKMDVKTKLQQVANSLGLGGKANYTIKNKDLIINLNMTVSMNAEDMEKALILREKSIIRQRLNKLADEPSDKMGPALPTTVQPIQDLTKTG